MFDIGFGELVLVFVIGLIVLGPQRLPVAVKTVAGWLRAMRTLASTVQNELAQELKLQEFQDSLKKVEKASMDNLTPELKASMDELREAADSMKRAYAPNDVEKKSDEVHQASRSPDIVHDNAKSAPPPPPVEKATEIDSQATEQPAEAVSEAPLQTVSAPLSGEKK